MDALWSETLSPELQVWEVAALVDEAELGLWARPVFVAPFIVIMGQPPVRL